MASERNKKYAIIGVSSLVLVAVMVALIASIAWDDGNKKEISASQKSIKNICQSTDYQQTCIDSLSSAAGDVTDPKDLIKIAFDITTKKIKEAASCSSTMQEVQKDPRTNEALKSCIELANLSINDLERSFHEMEELELSQLDEILTKMKIWLSGAMTYEETCLDGFEDTVGEAGAKMREILKTAMELTTNGLAMIDEISTALESLSIEQPATNRRLLSTSGCSLSDGLGPFLECLESGTRRILFESNPTNIKANLTVAKDGSGDYKTINEALPHIPKKSNETFVLYIKEGIYNETVQFNSSLTHLMVVGDGPTKTRITGRLNYIDGTPTYHTATVAVQGDYFIAKDIGFENSAGPEKHQAVALRVGADMSLFYNCHMDGYQDTLYAHTYRQFYRNCQISGTIDFIFGDAAAVFQNCTMVVRKPMPNQQCIVTAQGRKNARQPTGLILQNCTFVADPALFEVRNKTKSYLGRPWKEHSRTIIMESHIDDLIQPQGWLPWNESFALDTLFYTEFNNRGPSSTKEKRVTWKGIKELPKERIMRFTAAEFIEGDQWILKTGFPYTPGLIYPPPKENVTAISEYTPEEDLDMLGYKREKSSFFNKEKPASDSKGESSSSKGESSSSKGESSSSKGESSSSKGESSSSSGESSSSKGESSSSKGESSSSKGESSSSKGESSSSKEESSSSNGESSSSKGESSSSNGESSSSKGESSSSGASGGGSEGSGGSGGGSGGNGGDTSNTATIGVPESHIAASPADAPAMSPDASPTASGGSWLISLFG